MKPAKTILAINGGSSSIKFVSFEMGHALNRISEAEIQRIGLPGAKIQVKDLEHRSGDSRLATVPDYKTAVNVLMDWIGKRTGSEERYAIGHRVVQGGPGRSFPERLTAGLIEELRAKTPFDPEHLPGELLLIEAFLDRFPDLPQVVCFDTAFHRDLPTAARLLPIPRRYEARGVRRYGFHGLSYQSLMDELHHLGDRSVIQGRVILAHLGSGASLAAVLNGKSIDTSMSFTPTSGLPMGTRSGDLDPGLAWYMQESEGMDAKDFNKMVCFQSGLLGISETSSDMRDLLKRETHDVRARDAIEVFCYQVKKWIGAYAAALGGLDTLVFSGGIGQNAPTIRSRICEGLEFLGIELEENLKETDPGVISTTESHVVVRVIPTNEELVIAQTTRHVLELPGARTGDLNYEYKNALP